MFKYTKLRLKVFNFLRLFHFPHYVELQVFAETEKKKFELELSSITSGSWSYNSPSSMPGLCYVTAAPTNAPGFLYVL